MTNALKIASITLVMSLMGAAASSAMAAPTADSTWQKNHPRREQVNNRLANQNKRIKTEVKEGDLTKSQAAALHKEDHRIRQEERLMASQNGSHITTQEHAEPARELRQQANRQVNVACGANAESASGPTLRIGANHDRHSISARIQAL